MWSRRSLLVGLLARVLIVALVLGSLPAPAAASARLDPLRGSIHADGLGSIRRLTDEAGNITDGYTYSAFGELLAHTGTDTQSYAFTGEPLDPNSGFQYHRARWMDPGTGRFPGVDPWEGSPFEPVTLHRYLYASGSPLDNVDPSGEQSLPQSLTTISLGVTVALSNVGAQLSSAFQRGGPVIGQLFVRLGHLGQYTLRNILLQYQRFKPDLIIRTDVPVGRKLLDFGVELGPKVANIEAKYGLPWRRGDSLRRLVEQMQASVASGTRTVLWALKEPTSRQVALLQRELGPLYEKIDKVYGVEAMWKWLVSFLGPV